MVIAAVVAEVCRKDSKEVRKETKIHKVEGDKYKTRQSEATPFARAAALNSTRGSYNISHIAWWVVPIAAAAVVHA